MKYKGFIARVIYDDNNKIFTGSTVNSKDVIRFSGASVDELEEDFKKSVDDYLNWFEEDGISIDIEKIISGAEVNKLQKAADNYLDARDKACKLIDDALARYIKEKTRARSKKAAMEKESLLNSPKYDELSEYECRQDIEDYYLYDSMSRSECDRLQELWDERESIKSRTDSGVYKDDVTEALQKCWVLCANMWNEEILTAELSKALHEKQKRDIENVFDRVG